MRLSKIFNVTIVILSITLYSYNNPFKKNKVNNFDKLNLVKTIDYKKINFYTLKNANGSEATFTNYGARLVSLKVPDKNGRLVNVVCGFKNIDEYKKASEPYYGATIGRYGNRIAKGKFILDNQQYILIINNFPNTLHGGKKGFQYQEWNAHQPDGNTIIFTRLSKDMEEGFPGNLQVKVTYHLSENNSLDIEYNATTDKSTIVNLTNHAFFNLNGEGSGTILNHKMQIFASNYTPVDIYLIPTGKITSVKRTPFDFLKPKVIGAQIEQNNEQLKFGKGYDHNFILDNKGENHLAAIIVGDKTGIKMKVYTDEPGLQFYSGNFMKGDNTFSNGVKDSFRTAFAMETQHFPDSPNQPLFPSTILRPGQKYFTKSKYVFSTKK